MNKSMAYRILFYTNHWLRALPFHRHYRSIQRGLSLAVMLACMSLRAATVADLIINEIQVANIDQFIDPSFNYGGWIELYNPTDTTLSLTRMYISDNPDEPKKWRFPSTMGTDRAQNFRVIWFDHYAKAGDNSYSSNAYKQVPFKLNYEGGTIYLYDAYGKLVAEQTYPPAITRASYARTTDGGYEWAYTSTPTPEASNDGSTFAATQLAPPVVSINSKVYSDILSFNVTIPTGTDLYYTTDGSTPTLTNGTRSTTGRFAIASKNIVYRFRLFRKGNLPSPVVTRTFIYADRDYYLPIVSVVTAPDNLYNSRIGVYVDGNNGTSGNNKSMSNKNRAWERPVNFEYLVPDPQVGYHPVINQETDFEVCGGWSRHFFSHASFRLKASKQYEGNNYFTYDFFPTDKPHLRHKAIQLRNGGNDWECRITDAAIQQCVIHSGFYVDCEAVQPAHVFFNGVYQLMLNAREPSNRNLAYSNYGIDKDSVDQFEINGVVGYEQKAGDDIAFRRWMTLARQLSSKPSDESIYAQICQLVDIDEYCNYMAAECYLGSGDWLTNSNNVKGFRARRDDGRFHLVMMDLDSAFGSTSMLSQLSNHLNDSRYNTGRNFLIDIFLCMLRHEGFKRRFIDAYCLVAGSVFEPQRCSEIVRQLASATETALSFEGRSPWGSANSLISRFNNSSDRAARIATLRNYFRLPQGYVISLDSDIKGATFHVNQQQVPTGQFSGTLFAPAQITTTPPPGCRFTGWSTDAQTENKTLIGLNSQWYFYDQGSLDGRAWTTNSYSASTWEKAPAPFGYGTVGITAGAGDYSTLLDYGSDSGNKRPTYYFRSTFDLATAPTGTETFLFTYYVDDGCVVYVNGKELTRYHMPEGTPLYSTYATEYEGNLAYSSVITIPNNLLRAGRNVIAVEVHNCSAGSSDIFWGATLTHSSSKPFSASSAISLSDLGSAGTYTLTAHFERIPDEHLTDSLVFPIRINEVSAANNVFVGDYFKHNDWLELYNTTDSPLDVSGLAISDNLGSPLVYQLSPAYANANSAIIPPHGHLVVWADKLTPITQLHAPFKLANADHQAVTITSTEDFVTANADFFKAHPALTRFTDVITYDRHAGDQSIGRFPDGTNDVYRMSRPTIERANTCLTADEFLYHDPGYEQVLTGITDIAFLNSEGSQDSPSNSAGTDSADLIAVYNTSGLLVARSAYNLRPGLYLLRYSNGTSRKITIR